MTLALRSVRTTFAGLLCALPCLLIAGLPTTARAEIPRIFDHKAVVAIEIAGESSRLMSTKQIGIELDTPLTRKLLREAIDRLLQSGHFTDVQIDAYAAEGGVRLVVLVAPRIVVSRVEIRGNAALDEDAVRNALGVADHSEMNPERMQKVAADLGRAYAEKGYLRAVIDIRYRDTDDPSTKVLMVEVNEGVPTVLRRVSFDGEQPLDPPRLLQSVGIRRGAVLDRTDLETRIEAAEKRLRKERFFEARLGKPLVTIEHGEARVTIPSYLGPRYEVRIQDSGPLTRRDVREALQLYDHRLTPVRRNSELPAAVVDLYRRHGFPSARARVLRLRGKRPGTAVLQVQVEPGEQLQVISTLFFGARHFSQTFLTDQLDAYLEEDLPGNVLVAPVDSEVVDRALAGAQRAERSVPRPLRTTPQHTYYASTYEQALAHVTELYRAEGYLSAEVGPAKLQKLSPRLATVAIPVEEGPRTMLHDVVLTGQQTLTPRELLVAARLQRNQPFSYLAMEEARLRIIEAYQERGFMFATIEPLVRFSRDQTRAELEFKITESYPVTVDRIIVRGAERTDEGLVRRLMTLQPGALYRPSLARDSETELQSLGVFTGVAVGLEDAGLPERRKAVVVQLTERRNQFLDFSGGLSTGQGMRGGFEYGYRNLFGQAVGLTLRVYLGYQLFFVDKQIEERFKALTDLDKRIERNVSLGIVIPRIRGFGRVRTSIDLVHLRDNERDFGVDKNGIGVTFTHRPIKPLAVTFGGDFENNSVDLFVEQALNDYLAGVSDQRLRRLLRVPAGNTTLVAARTSASFDQRDNPFVPTRGYIISVSGELARTLDPARKRSEASATVDTFESEFIKATASASVYAPVGGKVVLAGQARIGRIMHLTKNSRTYPNRAFFLGGVDTMRGYPQYSMVPQDIAETVADDPNLTSGGIVRAADAFVLLRGELRVPLYQQLGAGLFTDLGNLWADASAFDPTRLRPTVGAGLRFATPVGPIAVDYGIIARRRRSLSEPFGTLHLSIGLF